MSAPYQAAMIGCGRIGSTFADHRATVGVYSHAEAYVECAATELVAVCDRDRERAARCAARWNVPRVFDSIGDLLADAAPEIVSICTPDETHFDVGVAALEAPATRAVLMEKPLALDPQQARHLIALAEERGVVLAVNYSRRYATGFQDLREKLAAGLLGRVQSVSGFYTKGVMHNGTHWFDIARFLLGEITRVSGHGSGAGADPTLDARLEFASGAAGFLHGCDAQAYDVFELDILGTAGRVRILELGSVMEFFDVCESTLSPGYLQLARVAETQPGLRDLTLHAVEDVAACLREPQRRPFCSAADGLMALEIATAVRQSARTGAPSDIISRS